MKNTHHTEMSELLIGRDLSWTEEGGLFREELAPYEVNEMIRDKRGRKRK